MFRFPVIIENPVCSTVGMLRLLRTRIAEEARKLSHDEAWLDICRVDPVESTTPALEFNLLNGLLCDISRQKRHVVLIIEQAHLVHNADTLEQLTMLMNLQYKGRRRLLTVLYFGHEGVVPFIRQHPSFMQRIPCCWHIHALSEEQTAEYIKHRIMVAGTDRQIFTAEALELIWKHSDGIPREINNICDFALFLGASAEVEFIDGNLVQQVCRDVDLFASGSAIV
jgi:general secretion pathway protein A